MEAKRLVLYSGLPVAAVAARLGFSDPSNFGRFFRRETGLSPGEYRVQINELMLAVMTGREGGASSRRW